MIARVRRSLGPLGRAIWRAVCDSAQGPRSDADRERVKIGTMLCNDVILAVARMNGRAEAARGRRRAGAAPPPALL